jgi:hypothetical protein
LVGNLKRYQDQETNVLSVGLFWSASAVALAAISLWPYQQNPSPAHEIKPPAAETRALADDLVASIKRHNPEIGTVLGLPDAEHGRIIHNSLDARAVRRSEEDVFRSRLSAIDQTALEGRPEWLIYGFVKLLNRWLPLTQGFRSGPA